MVVAVVIIKGRGAWGCAGAMLQRHKCALHHAFTWSAKRARVTAPVTLHILCAWSEL